MSTTRPTPAVAASAADAPVTGLSRTTLLLSAGLAVAALVAAVPTVLDAGLLRGPAAMNGSARGTALVMACLAVPVLVLAVRGLLRGSPRAWPAALGAVAYLLYNGVMLTFGTPFNHAFLAYVAVLGLSVWTAVALLHDLDVEAYAARLRPSLPVRPIAVYTWVIAGLNALLWLRGAVPASLQDGSPAVLDGTGLTTVPTYVQDLAFWLPLLGIGGWWLWHRATWGYVVISAGLTMWVLEGIGVAADQYWGHLADPSSTVVVPGMIPVFLVLAAIGLIPVLSIVRRLPGAR